MTKLFNLLEFVAELPANPTPANPISSIAHVEGSGTAATVSLIAS
jgi:hypothetical protein